MKTAREIACDILTPYNLATPEEIAVVAEAIRSYGEAVREDYRKKNAYYGTARRRELLEDFCRRMEEWGYIDSDWWSEEPDAIDRYEQHLLELANMKGER